MSTFGHNQTSDPFALPSAPESQSGPVKAWSQAVSIPTYSVSSTSKNTAFPFYPMPVADQAAPEPTPSIWQAIHLENEFLRLMILPELGGRVYLGVDKANGYDLFHRQNVIKLAQVGFKNPCASGGLVFHWPQDDGLAASLPVAAHIEEHSDGSRTVWCGRYDPLSRAKGLHGVCLYPGRAYLEIKVRLFNCTPFTQNFLWSSHAAVHPQDYQFFSDGASGDFLGGYHHGRQAGVIHVADHHLAPFKKRQTDQEHSCGELIAGAYTRNLFDLSLLAPYETKAFSEFWYPVAKAGPAGKANVDVAVNLQPQGELAQVGVYATRAFPKAVIALLGNGKVLAQWTHDLGPATPFVEKFALPAGTRVDEWTLTILTSASRPLISYTPGKPEAVEASRPAAGPPPPPRKVTTVEELYLIGSRLQKGQYGVGRPEEYWREGLRRDANDSRCNGALGLWHLQRGEFREAEAHLRRAIGTLTAGNSDSYAGEQFYYLGLALRYEERDDEAYDAFYAASWSFPWRAPALYAIAEIDTKRGNYGAVPKHLHEALRLNADNNYARNLAAVLFRRFGKTSEAEHLLRESLALDPSDAWACQLSGQPIPGDNQTRLDLAFGYARAGLPQAAIEVLTAADTFVTDGSLPIVHYALGSFYTRIGDLPAAGREYLAAAQSSPDGCFPYRLDELVVLARAVALQPHDARAQYYLANLLYGRGRHAEAMELWENSARLDGSFATVWRNLGIGYYNLRNDVPKAFEAFDQASAADRSDAQILYERDQLWKRAGVPPAVRLKELEEHQTSVESRDDLAVELAALFNDVHQPVRALALLSSHRFQPSDRERSPRLEQYIRTHLKLGRQALKSGDPRRAFNLFSVALQSPPNLGEARRSPADSGEIWFWLGEAYYAANERATAQEYWRQAADLKPGLHNTPGVFPSETVFYSGMALARLGERLASRRLFRELWFQGRKLAREKSHETGSFPEERPLTYPFKDDPAQYHRTKGLFLQAQARFGLSQYKLTRRLLDQVLTLDPNNGRALDLLEDLSQAKET